jgi:predicted amidophosphoribosyltransferase
MQGDPWASYGYIRDYNPYWLPGRVMNPAFRRPEDALVLDLKDGYENGIDHARQEFLLASLELDLPEDTLVAIVPGHEATASNAGRPLANVVARLPNWNGALRQAADTLIRHTTVAKLAAGGDRGIEVHIGSVHIPRPQTVAGRDVFLIDDVTTTGNSLRACRELLVRAGTRRIAAVALARTVAP